MFQEYVSRDDQSWARICSQIFVVQHLKKTSIMFLFWYHLKAQFCGKHDHLAVHVARAQFAFLTLISIDFYCLENVNKNHLAVHKTGVRIPDLVQHDAPVHRDVAAIISLFII